MPVQVLFQVINNGLRPEIPAFIWQYADGRLKRLIERCWHEVPDVRPNFLEIVEELKVIIAFSDHK